jgi:1-phosphatidylinositol phosphodiesterase
MRRALLLSVVAACGGGGPTDNSAWMASVGDSANLASLSIPGTHDSGAMMEPYMGLAKAQDLTFAQQLPAGVRYFDVRCRDVGDEFLIYHGAIDQEQHFADVLTTMLAFLDTNPSETLIVSVKEEDTEEMITMPFDAAFQTYVAQAAYRWNLTAAVPNLGDVRGKLVLLRRFDTTATTPLGIDATNWPDDMSFALGGLQVEDNYVVDDMTNDTKWNDITANLGSAEAAGSASGTLFLTYTSGYQTVQALPDITLVSDDINARLDTYLADPANAHAHLGVMPMDFVTEARATAIIDTN